MTGFSSLLTRRAALTGLAGLALGAPRLARAQSGNVGPGNVGLGNVGPANAASGWTREAYLNAMAQSGRSVSLGQASFDAIQARRPAALKLIASYLKEHLGSADPAVMDAFAQVPREYYHYNYEDHAATPSEAYESNPKPWAIGYGSALSDYLGQAYMTQVCQPKPGQVALEIGTGSGFQSSVLSRIVGRMHSIEIIEPLGHRVGKIFAPLGYDNVHSRVGDGFYGWPEVDGGFDIIIVTCAAQYAPPELFKQMKPGARMIIPIGQPYKKGQILYIYTKDENGKIHSRRDVGVYFIPMTGAMMKTPRPEAPKSEAPKPEAVSSDAPKSDD